MANLPEPIQDVINAFSRLPGIGPKTASRLAFYLLNAQDDISINLAEALQNLKSSISFCQVCFNITLTGQTVCDICQDEQRDSASICVVEEPLDVMVIEKTGAFKGRYHVLQGVLSPIEGIGPDDINVRQLVERIRLGNVKEVILATNPSMEGDATAAYIRQVLLPMGLRITRLARGLPVGGDLEYADQNTLLRALSGRQEMS